MSNSVRWLFRVGIGWGCVFYWSHFSLKFKSVQRFQFLWSHYVFTAVRKPSAYLSVFGGTPARLELFSGQKSRFSSSRAETISQRRKLEKFPAEIRICFWKINPRLHNRDLQVSCPPALLQSFRGCSSWRDDSGLRFLGWMLESETVRETRLKDGGSKTRRVLSLPFLFLWWKSFSSDILITAWALLRLSNEEFSAITTFFMCLPSKTVRLKAFLSSERL